MVAVLTLGCFYILLRFLTDFCIELFIFVSSRLTEIAEVEVFSYLVKFSIDLAFRRISELGCLLIQPAL